MTLTLFITVGLIGFIGGEKGDVLRKSYRYSKVTPAPVHEITATPKSKDITKIPIRQRTKKPVAGILYAPTSTVTEHSKETVGYKHTKAAALQQSESTIFITRQTLPPVESSSITTLLASSLQSSTFKAPSSLAPLPQTTAYSHKPSSQSSTTQAQTSGYSNKPTSKSSSQRAAISHHKQSPSTVSTTSSTATTSRRLASGKGYRNGSNSINKIVSNVTGQPQTTQPEVTKRVQRGRGGYKYKIPEAIKPTDDGYAYNKVVKRQ